MPKRIRPATKIMNASIGDPNTPSAASPRTRRWTTCRPTIPIAASEMTKPMSENACSGASENPVTRSKLSRISL